MTVEAPTEEVYEIANVRNHRMEGHQLELQIEWVGFPDVEDMTWEPYTEADPSWNSDKHIVDKYFKSSKVRMEIFRTRLFALKTQCAVEKVSFPDLITQVNDMPSPVTIDRFIKEEILPIITHMSENNNGVMFDSALGTLFFI
jgi:hypothetical protein